MPFMLLVILDFHIGTKVIQNLLKSANLEMPLSFFIPTYILDTSVCITTRLTLNQQHRCAEYIIFPFA